MGVAVSWEAREQGKEGPRVDSAVSRGGARGDCALDTPHLEDFNAVARLLRGRLQLLLRSLDSILRCSVGTKR